jgi:hypothetical protein
MAEKHKSKYKAPENKKPTYRKDLKDYTLDDKDGKLNPKSAGEKMPNLLRKTDKEMQDDGKLYPTYNADDRLYKDLEDGEYDPKTALKRLKKRQDKEEKDVEDVLKDKIENLTREQKERLVREYIRRKIAKVLTEQALNEQPAPAPEEEEAPEATPDAAATPEADPAATPATDAPATPDAAAAPTPDAAAAPTPAPAAPTTPAPDAAAAPAPAATDQLPPEEQNAIAIDKFVNFLQKETGNIARTKAIGKVLDSSMKEAEPADARNFYKLILKMVAKKYKNVVDAEQEPAEKQ